MELLEWIVNSFSKEKDTVMDNTMGNMQEDKLKDETPTTFGGLFKSWLAKFACHHKCDVYNESGKARIGFEQTLICQNCGKIKKLKL